MEEQEKEREVEVRGNGSQLFTETYSEAAVSRLKNLILTFFANDERKYYSISVDGETVVGRNCDGRKFDRYLQFVTKHTQMVEVKMYQGFSPNCNKYQFLISRGLSGTTHTVDVETQIEKALEEQRLQNELAELRNEVAIKDKKLKKLKAEGGKGIDFEKLLEKLPQVLGIFGIGKGQALAGVTEPQAEVEVQAETDTTKKEENIDPTAKEIYNELYKAYGEDGIKNVLKWIAILKANPDVQEKIKVELINKQKKNENGKA